MRNRTIQRKTRFAALFLFLAVTLCCAGPLRASAMLSAEASEKSEPGEALQWASFDVTPKGMGNASTKSVPILMYHSITQDAKEAEHNSMQVTAKVFRSHISALKKAGYTAVLYQDLYNFVETGKALPKKPVVITFDDGYTNNLTLAAPILKEFGFKAEIAVIGCSVGRDSYKNSGTPIIPHFSMKDAEPWVKSGVIHLHSHSYNMHQVPDLDGGFCRHGVSPQPGETAFTYKTEFKADYRQNMDILETCKGNTGVNVYTYPYGRYHTWSEQTLYELNVPISVTIEPGIARITYHISSSLRLLPRITVTDSMTAAALLKRIGG